MNTNLLSALIIGTILAPGLSAAGRIAVIGVGEIRARPDQADLSIRIEATRPKVREAMAAADAAVRATLSLCLAAARDSADAGAGQVSVDKEFRWVKNSSVFVGWKASREVNLRLRDLDRLGPLLEALASVKGAHVEGVAYLHGERDSLERIAEAKALEQARLSAQGLAAGLGRALGEAVTVRNFPPAWDNGGGSIDNFEPKRMGGMARGSSQGYLVKPDQIVVQALVSVEFETGPALSAPSVMPGPGAN